MSIDLEPVRSYLEETILTDRARVDRDVSGTGDDELGDDLILRPPTGDTEPVWTDQPCAVIPRERAVFAPLPGGLVAEPTDVGEYVALVPLGAGRVERDDWLTLTVAERDPQLAGTVFRVLSEGKVSTFAVVRFVPLDRVPT